MNRLYRAALLPGITLLLLTGCSKQEGIQTVSNYTFRNTTGDRITLDVYNTREDYDNNAGLAAKYYIDAGTTRAIPLTALRTYWIDWYNNTYSYNNWEDSSNVSAYNYPKSELKIAVEDDHIDIVSLRRDTARSVLLNGNGLSSTWQITIDNELDRPELNGTYHFLFTKGFSGRYTFTNTSGTAVTKPITYSVYSLGQTTEIRSFRVVVLDERSVPITRMDCYPDANYGPPTGRDTMLAYFDGTVFTYPATRQ